MANKTNKSATESTTVQRPEGMQKRGDTDLAGFWVPKMQSNPITFVPRSAKVFDSKLDKYRPAILIIGQLVAACDGVTSDGEVVTFKQGDWVGVWGKPGMRDIANCANVRTWLMLIEEKDIGKAKPMKVFDVYSDDGGQRLEYQDRRKHSAEASHFLMTEPSDSGESRAKKAHSMTVPLDANGEPIF